MMWRGPKKFSIAESSNNFSCDHVNRTDCQMNNSPGVLNHTGPSLLLSSLGERAWWGSYRWLRIQTSISSNLRSWGLILGKLFNFLCLSSSAWCCKALNSDCPPFNFSSITFSFYKLLVCFIFFCPISILFDTNNVYKLYFCWNLFYYVKIYKRNKLHVVLCLKEVVIPTSCLTCIIF